MRQTESLLNFTNFAEPLNATVYDSVTAYKLHKAGFDIHELLSEINRVIPSPFPNDSVYPLKVAFLADMDVIASGLRVGT